jgi:hypothetical protein
MLSQKRIRLRRNNETIIIYTDGARSACPVCGCISKGDDPYYALDASADGGSANLGTGVASFDTCPCCKTEFGNDDWVDGVSVSEQWTVLRDRWLERQRWSEDALAQVFDGLGLRISKPPE